MGSGFSIGPTSEALAVGSTAKTLRNLDGWLVLPFVLWAFEGKRQTEIHVEGYDSCVKPHAKLGGPVQNHQNMVIMRMTLYWGERGCLSKPRQRCVQ